MAGYTTRSRRSNKPLDYKYMPQGTSTWKEVPVKDLTVSRSTQTTYSYRTSGPGDRDDDLEIFRYRNGFRTNPTSFDSGHEFWSYKYEGVKLSHPHEYLFDTQGNRYFGPLLLSSVDWSVAAAALPRMTSSEINYYGGRAIAATRPINPSASLSTVIGEGREGIPSLPLLASWKSATSRARFAGGEYLNVQFGWFPLISDIRKILRSLHNATASLQQAQRDSDRMVRRRFSFPEEVVVSSPPTLTASYALTQSVAARQTLDLLGQHGSSGPGYLRSATRTTSTKTWFAGAYTYHWPDQDSLMGKIGVYDAQANLLLGTRVTPELLWELAPWSWLADWIGNIGTVLSNATALSSDNLVMRYGYLMRSTQRMDVYSARDFSYGNVHLPVVTNYFRSSLKERVQATPYGFGLNPSLFSARQWTILAALGMTKSPRALR